MAEPSTGAAPDPILPRLKSWIDTFADDCGAVKTLVGEAGAAREARILAAAGLSYLCTRLDLIPDWEEAAGVLDDAMVIRVALALASEKGFGSVDAGLEITLARMANEIELIEGFLGPDLFARFKRYVTGLTTLSVRGRTPAQIVDDERARRHLFGDVEDELRRVPPAPMKDPDGVARQIKNHFSTKLAP